MSLYCLVHGAFHGGWCWEPLAQELVARGHSVIAPDLPCDDPAAGASAYAEVVATALASSGNVEPPIVVGHSLAGSSIPLVADRVPVRMLVYLCAFVPQPGRAFVDWSGEEADLFVPVDAIWPERDASTVIYATNDVAINPRWLQRISRERFAKEAVGIDAGHAPFLSRPAALADMLVAIGAGQP